MKRFYYVIGGCLIVLLTVVNVMQINNNRQLRRAMITSLSSYQKYVEHTFSLPSLSTEQINPYRDYFTSTDGACDYIVYVPINVCHSCLLSLYADFVEFGLTKTDVLFIHTDERLSKEGGNYDYSNQIYDKDKKFLIDTGGYLAIFKYNKIYGDVTYFLYDPAYKLILESFL
jgi:hypothetical protein